MSQSDIFEDAIGEQLRPFMDHSPAAAWVKDVDGRHVYLSKPYLEMVGVPHENWLGTTDFDLWPHDVAEKHRLVDKHVLRTGRPIQFENEETITSNDGTTRYWWITKFPFSDDRGQMYVGGIAVEITEHRRTQEALKLEHLVSDRLIESARNIVMVLDNDGQIVRFNPFLEQLCGWKQDEVVGRRWSDVYLRGDNRDEVQRRFETALHRVHHRGHLTPITTKSGDTLIIEWYNSPLHDTEGNVAGLLCIGADTTQRQSIERKIEFIASDEQRRIGHELHDGVGQELTALRLFCEHLTSKLEQLDPADTTDPESLRSIQSLASKVEGGLRAASANIQSLSRSMASEASHADSLASLLTNLAETTDSLPEFECQLHCEPSTDELNHTAELQLYRIAQEAVNNAVKHSGGSRIEISLTGDGKETTLAISDNGVGVPRERARSNSAGIGLQVMHYRADLMGAELSITNNADAGACVSVTLRSPDQ